MSFLYEVPDYKKLRVIIDTDTACEADDPFAIAHALLSPKLMVKGIVAEHFRVEGSMERSYQAMKLLVDKLGMEANLLRGEEYPLEEGTVSEGVRFIIDEARREDEHPLFVLCLGALSNMARALRIAPDIASRLTVVTIGGQSYDGHGAPFREFNFGNDVKAANEVLAAPVPLWQIPMSAYGSIRVGLAELQRKVLPCGEAGEYLFRQMEEYNRSEHAGWTAGESWTLGDSPAVAVILDPSIGTKVSRPAPIVMEDTSYQDNPCGRTIQVYDRVDSRFVLEDFFAKLAIHAGL
ncbi:MAG: nucleoside hydrolase [Clostridiales bacterium]|nr:nucleoside hydrolase [Clostridiales bacterium]